jgi:threonine/homoserine/homoserine lactone efflux protein
MAGTLGTWFTQSDSNQIYLNRIAAVVFVGLAVKLLASNLNA